MRPWYQRLALGVPLLGDYAAADLDCLFPSPRATFSGHSSEGGAAADPRPGSVRRTVRRTRTNRDSQFVAYRSALEEIARSRDDRRATEGTRMICRSESPNDRRLQKVGRSRWSGDSFGRQLWEEKSSNVGNNAERNKKQDDSHHSGRQPELVGQPTS